MNLGDDFELRFFFCLDTIKTKLYNIRRLIESRYACIFTDGIIIESPISHRCQLTKRGGALLC
jgi:hypothetical protein